VNYLRSEGQRSQAAIEQANATKIKLNSGNRQHSRQTPLFQRDKWIFQRDKGVFRTTKLAEASRPPRNVESALDINPTNS
jgi:hypothetical protein